MAKGRALRKRDLRELGWRALVTELGVVNATRFVMDLSEGTQHYSRLRRKLFAGKTIDELYAAIEHVHPARGRN